MHTANGNFSPRYIPITLLFGLVLLNLAQPVGADWPTYQHDNARGGATSEAAPAAPRVQWVYRSPARPLPAWDEPALWDGWAKVHDLTNRQTFDKTFPVAIAGGRVYFGSSVDDKVYCRDADTGEEIWSFFTEGPVRLAPTVDGQRVYVGSDDGFVYCLTADTGRLIWKHRPGPHARRVAGNERVVSPWAVRTSVVAAGDTVYCGAGVIPSEGVYVCALRADSGAEIWKSEMNDVPAQGYMLASPTRLYVVTSRDRPVVFDAKSGKRLHQVEGGTGGTYALLTGDTLFFGPSKTGEVNMTGESRQDVLASFQGNHMIVAKPYSYLQNRDQLSALDRESYVKLYAERSSVARRKGALTEKAKEAKDQAAADLKTEIAELDVRIRDLSNQLKACLKWTVPCDCPFALVLADDALVAGGDGQVMAVDALTGETRWRRSVAGKAYGLAVSGGRLLVSTDEGEIHCFADSQTGAATDDLAAAPVVETKPVRLQKYVGPYVGSNALPPGINGPFAEFVAPGKVSITWDTNAPTTSVVEFGVDMEVAPQWTSDELTTRHEVIVNDVRRETVYRFRVRGTTEEGEEVASDVYPFDAHFDYLPTRAPERAAPYPADDRTSRYEEVVEAMLEAAGARRGYALVLGSEDGRLAYELARASELRIVVVEPNGDRVARIRRVLDAAGMNGTRISVHQHGLDDLPYGPLLANLIVADRGPDAGEAPVKLSTLYRCLRPAGGAVFWSASHTAGPEPFQAWRKSMAIDWESRQAAGEDFWVHRRDKLPGTGQWTHQYASADNSACSQDDQIRGPLMVQWWGRPGARPMPDRGSRNPPPVSANGRLYVQGNRTLFGLDAYNGAVLWAKQIPTMRRANMPRDGSNMVATDDALCVAIGGKCVTFDGQTGKRLANLEVPNFSPARTYDWGYVSRIENTQFGSAVREGSQYLGDEGEWFEKFDEKHIARVTSDGFFAMDPYTGETKWLYDQGVIINSSITMADQRVFFIESRGQAARDAASGRLLGEVLEDQVLVALDAATGAVLWQKPYDFSRCQFVTYMTHANGTLLVTGTDEKSVFHTYAFDAATGDELWRHEAADQKGHHTGELAHPTIVGDRVYFNKHTYDLRSGKVLGLHDFNWHGCGVMSASKHAVFSRYEYHGMLDLETNQRTEFLGIRSGCWLSLIPSGGLLLAPETSAGCSCGHSLQTSIAYVPKALADAVED